MAAKKKIDSEKNAERQGPPTPNYMASAGGFLVLLGGFAIAAIKFGGMAAPSWGLWVGLAIAACGGILWFMSGLPKEQSFEWVRSLIYALSIALVIRWGVAEPYRIPSSSMETTLHGDERIGRGDRVWVNKWIYGLRVPFMNARLFHWQEPERFDIVVFKTVEEESQHPTLVKRIIGMPGERIQIPGDGKVYVNGEALAMPDFMPENQEYTRYGKYGVLSADEYAVVPEGHYLMLGDNSASSRDGRVFGWMPNEHMVGRVASIWWPPPRWRDFTGFSSTLWWRTLLAGLAIATVFRLFIGRSWAVPSADGRGVDHLLVFFLATGLRIPFTPFWLARWGRSQRGDRVVYRPPGDAPAGAMLAGRIAGLPGEEVEIRDGQLYVNGDAIHGGDWPGDAVFDTSAKDAVFGASRKYTHVPEGHVFILADYPDHEDTLDSRTLGWVPLGNLDGKAALVWWPLARVGRIPR